MGYPNLTVTVSTLAIILCSLFVPKTVIAQESEFQTRQKLSGRQLFEHQWKSIDLPSQLLDRREQPRLNESADDIGEVPYGDGLGPLHNATSCSQCHVSGGSSGVKHNVTLITVDPRSEVLNDKTAGGGYLLEVFPGLLDSQGILNFTTVVHDRSTRPGYTRIRHRLTQFVPEGIDDQWFLPGNRTSEAIASRPVVAGRLGPVDFYLSQRNSPALFGAGRIDSINEVRILALAKKQAEKSDGQVTGRFVGKFGWRGQVSSLATFVAQACAAELGLSQGVVSRRGNSTRNGRGIRASVLSFTASQAGDPADFRYRNPGQDMTRQEVTKLTSFVASLPRPTERPRPTDTLGDVLDGERLFKFSRMLGLPCSRSAPYLRSIQ